MKKQNIVKNQRDFDRIIKTGTLIKNNSYFIYYENNDLLYNKFGVSVGKKLGNAVFRNKYKRKIRAIIDNNEINLEKNKNFIIILKGMREEKDYHQLEKDYKHIITKVRKD